MRHHIIVLCLFLSIALPLPTAAQPVTEPSQVVQRLRETSAIVGDFVANQSRELTRHAKLLTDLTDIGEGIAPPAISMALVHASQQLEVIRAEAESDPPLREPVPSCLDRLRGVLSRPGAELDPGRTRAEFFAALSPLENRLVQLSETADNETVMLQGFAQYLLAEASGYRADVPLLLRALVRTRKAALK